MAHEPSSVFIYDMIDAFGSVDLFYKKFYINSICPLGFTAMGKNNKEVNFNYYDNKALTNSVKNFIIQSIKTQIDFGIDTDICFCLGTSDNYRFLLELNNEKNFFKKIIPLDHPRYVMQYKSKLKLDYIDKYLKAFNNI